MSQHYAWSNKYKSWNTRKKCMGLFFIRTQRSFGTPTHLVHKLTIQNQVSTCSLRRRGQWCVIIDQGEGVQREGCVPVCDWYQGEGGPKREGQAIVDHAKTGMCQHGPTVAMLKQPFVNRTNIDNVKTTMRQCWHGEGVAALQQSQAMGGGGIRLC